MYSEVLQRYAILNPQGTKIVMLGYKYDYVLVSKFYHEQENEKKNLHTKVNFNSKVPEYINKEKFIFIEKMIGGHTPCQSLISFSQKNIQEQWI